ncbi:MAG: hypothetical protein ACRD0J_07375, partial [Acidimicrobiales bacterium]
LSGEAEGAEMGMDSGRLCVALSRHIRGAIVLTRPGLDETLRRGAVSMGRVVPEGVKGDWPSAPPPPSAPVDPAWAAWRAQGDLLDTLRRAGRVHQVHLG